MLVFPIEGHIVTLKPIWYYKIIYLLDRYSWLSISIKGSIRLRLLESQRITSFAIVQSLPEPIVIHLIDSLRSPWTL